jgi:NitT/TauT family transport system ATP-binding protein
VNALAAVPGDGAPTPSRSAEPYVKATAVSKIYAASGGRTVRALDSVSLEAQAGEFVAILGPSGCGKSTFVLAAAGLVQRSGGSMVIDGKEVTAPITDVGVVFQSPVLLDWRNALQNVMIQAEGRQLDRRVYKERAEALLTQVGLGGFEKMYPRELSGGMQQRVSICRALVHDPPLLLMDEPFGALDALTRDQMALDLQRIWDESRKTVLFVTHSVTEAVFLADRVVVLTPRPGRVDRVFDIDLPRPRTLAIRETREFQAYAHSILELFVARGVLREY